MLTCGTVFSLISFGLKAPLWIIMAVISLCLGATCISTGGIWCYYVIHRPQTGNDVSVRVKYVEGETLTSEFTEIMR